MHDERQFHEDARQFHEDALKFATRIVRENGGVASGGHLIDRLLFIDGALKAAKKKIDQLEARVGLYSI